MKKKIFLLGLFSILSISLGLIISTNNFVKAEETAENNLETLLATYYGDGTYKKDTKIYVDEGKVNVDLQTYFHAQVMVMERSTYYTKDALWMSRDNGEYSYYGTSYDGKTPNGVTNATAKYPLVTPTNTTKVLSGTNKNSMEEYYITLDDFINGTHTSAHTNDETIVLNEEWSVDDNGIYSNETEGVLDGFRLFTAPLWLGKTDENTNYIIYTKATIQEVESKLVMKLWVSSGDSGKLVDGVEADAEGNLLFSKAVISKKQADGLLQGKSENLQAGLGTDFEGYNENDNPELFTAPLDTPNKTNNWKKDNNGNNALGIQTGYAQSHLVEENGNTFLKIGGQKSTKIYRTGLALTKEIGEPGTYVAKIKIKKGENANITKFFFKINKNSSIDSNSPLQYINGGSADSVSGFFFNDKTSSDESLNFDFANDWTEYSVTFTIEEGSDVDKHTGSYNAAFVMYMGDSNSSGNHYLYVDDFEIYRVEDYGTDFEGYDLETHSGLFVQTGTLTTGWKKDGNGNAPFGIQYGYQGCKLFQEEDGNNALKVHGTKEIIRVGIDVNDIIANPGVYKVSLKFKLGQNADNVSNILFRYHNKKALENKDRLLDTGFYFKHSTEDVGLSKDEWVTLETVIVITEKIEFSSDLCFVLMVYTNGNKTNGTDAHPGNYVLVDDLQIEGYVFN